METIAVFDLFPFAVGQKIHIAGGPRKGDWEVQAVTERKVTLRCPVSRRTFEWNRFCYHVEDCQKQWPATD